MNGYFLRNNRFTVVCLLLVAVALGCKYKPSNQPNPRIVQGMLDLKNWDIQEQGPIALSGEWEFYWQQFLSAEQRRSLDPTIAKTYFSIPNAWNHHLINGTGIPATGYASFCSTILLKNYLPEMAFYIPEMSTAYEMYINGKKISANGSVGTTPQTSFPQYHPCVIIVPGSEKMDIILQISNFHDQKGGPRHKIFFGTEPQIRNMYLSGIALDIFLFSSILMIGLYYIGIYLLLNHFRASLYFSIFCLIIAVRILVTGQYFLLHLFPAIPWELLVNVLGITLFLSAPVFLTFVHSLFPDFIPRRYVQIVNFIGTVFTGIAVFTPRIVYSHLIGSYQILIILSAVVVLYALFHEVRRKKEGAVVFICGFLVFFITVLNDILVDNDLIKTPLIVPFGLFLFIFSQAFLLSQRFSKAYKIIDKQHSELTQSNKNLQSAIEKAAAANQVKIQFLNNISHELRTPLNGITGFTEMMLDTTLDTTQKEYIHNIKTSGEDLLTMINDILDFSKMESPDLEFQQIEFDPELLAYDVCEFFQSKIEHKPVELFCHIDEDLPVIITGDPNRYRQVISKLLGNALKFTRSGEINISLRVVEQTKDKIKIKAVIQDTGIGISSDFIDRIFEPFIQADGSSTREFGGTGLGLSICKEVAKKMGGDIQVESWLNIGSTFLFSAWFGKTSVKPPVPRIKTTSLKGKKIAVVDDNQNSLEFMTHMLSSAGISIVKTSSIQEMRSELERVAAENQSIDACIVNIKRQEKDLFSIARDIRSFASGKQDTLSDNRRLPLIAVSSVLRSKDCMESGFDGFLNKPIRRDRLLLMIEKVIGSKDEPSLPLKIANQYSIREEIKHSLNILLVEDNLMNQKIAKLMIQKAGYHVETANNGREAVDEILKNPDVYHLILMDIQMPEMDGITATKIIREKGCSEIPIIALTAHAQKEDREACLSAGMNEHITKPLKREKLYDLLRTWVIEK
jgi:two-component system, sensor histidine kinase and response regulator